MASALGRLMVVIGADTSEATAGFDRVNRGLDGIGKRAGQARIGTKQFEGALRSLASETLGYNSQLVRLGSLLSTFAVSGGVTIGVLGGAALIGAALKHMTEDAKKFEESLKGVVSGLDNLVRKQGFGGQFDLFQMKANAQAGAAGVRAEMAPLQARRDALLQTPAAFRLPGVWDAALRDVQASLEPLQRDLETWERRIGAVDRAFQDAIPSIEGITVVATRMADQLAAFRNVNLGFGPELDARVGARRAAPDTRPDWVKNLPRELTPMSGSGSGGGATAGASRFADAVDKFTGGVGDMLKGTFSMSGLTQIGANLTSQVVGKLLGEVMGLFNRSAQRLADVMEQNTRALTASNDFLQDRLGAAGLSGVADEARDAVRETLDRFAVGDLTRGPPGRIRPNPLGLTLGEELAQRGIDLSVLEKIASTLGISLDALSADVLQSFYDQLVKATEATENFTEAMRNAPRGFKVALARFNASSPESGAAWARGGAYRFKPYYEGA